MRYVIQKFVQGVKKVSNDQTISLRIINEKKGNAVSGIHGSKGNYTVIYIKYIYLTIFRSFWKTLQQILKVSTLFMKP